MILYCDNVFATYLTTNPAYHDQSEHVDVDYHFVREMVAKGGLMVRHVPTQLQAAHIFTKGHLLICLLNMVSIYPLFHPAKLEGVY